MRAQIDHTRVSFASRGVDLSGHLFLPTGSRTDFPCVVMAHGFSGTQDRLFDGAERLARAGMAALTFDYASFGESGGEPRQVIDIEAQRRDWHSAVACARARGEIDPNRIALWGSSLGGTYTLFVAATDPRIAAVVAQIPYAGLPKERVGRTRKQGWRLLWLALKDRVRGWVGRSPLYVPAVGTPEENAVLVDPHAREIAASLAEGNSLWRNEIAPRVIFDILRLKPSTVAPEVRAPLLVTIAEKDTEAPPYLTRRLAELAPHGELHSYPVSHYEMYRPDLRARVFADQATFLGRHLLTQSNHLGQRARGGDG